MTGISLLQIPGCIGADMSLTEQIKPANEERVLGRGSFWTYEKIEELKRLLAENWSDSRIAAKFRVTRNSVIGKRTRMGMTKKRLNRPYAPRPVCLPKAMTAKPAAKKANGNWAWRPTPLAPIEKVDNPIGLRMKKPLAECAFTDLPPETSRFACTIFDLTNESCRFPVGDAVGHAQMFCGCPSADLAAGMPYCPQHMVLSYTPPRPRSRDAA